MDSGQYLRYNSAEKSKIWFLDGDFIRNLDLSSAMEVTPYYHDTASGERVHYVSLVPEVPGTNHSNQKWRILGDEIICEYLNLRLTDDYLSAYPPQEQEQEQDYLPGIWMAMKRNGKKNQKWEIKRAAKYFLKST